MTQVGGCKVFRALAAASIVLAMAGGLDPVAAEEVLALEKQPSLREQLLDALRPRLKPPLRRGEPEDARSYFNQGLAYADSGLHEKAVACFKRAVELRPGWALAHYNLGWVYQLMGHWEELGLLVILPVGRLPRHLPRLAG